MDLPVISVDAWLQGNEEEQQIAAKECADGLVTFGAVVVKDSRVAESDNAAFLDMMEDYFAQPNQALLKDTRPEFHFQVGATLENTEKPVCAADVDCKRMIQALDPKERPLDLLQQHKDPKCRFFWRMQQHNELPNIVPDAFPDWEAKMTKWGTQMKTSVSSVAEMLAAGLGLPPSTFVDAASNGAHLLAPTASDLSRFGRHNEILAGFHSDLNFLTIHGRSRFPGLNIWAKNTGRRIAVKVPPGHLLVQTAMQLEHLTNNYITAGFHEVVCNEATLAAIELAKKERPGRPLIRISSILTGWDAQHLSPDFQLEPLKKFVKNGYDTSKYPSMTVAEHLQSNLRKIALAQGS